MNTSLESNRTKLRGFDAVDAGSLANAKLLELMGNLIIKLGYGEKLGLDIGFKLVRGKQ